jgi:hypothetical protein
MREIPQLLEGVRDLLQATATTVSSTTSDEGKYDDLEVTRLLQLLALTFTLLSYVRM